MRNMTLEERAALDGLQPNGLAVRLNPLGLLGMPRSPGALHPLAQQQLDLQNAFAPRPWAPVRVTGTPWELLDRCVPPLTEAEQQAIAAEVRAKAEAAYGLPPSAALTRPTPTRWRWLCAFLSHRFTEHVHEVLPEQPYPCAEMRRMYRRCSRCDLTRGCGCRAFEEMES